MPIMTGDRDDVVRSTYGHTIGFKKGENVFVPPILEQACLDRGHRLAMRSAPMEEPQVTEEAKPPTKRRVRKPAQE